MSLSSLSLVSQQHFPMGTALLPISPRALRPSSSADMTAKNSPAVCQSATALPCTTRLVITKKNAKIKQDNYWRKIQEYAITNFPQLMNAEERLEDRKNSLFKGILIKNHRKGNPSCREVVNEKGCTVYAQLVGPSRIPNQAQTDPVLILANSRTKSVATDVTVISHSSSNTRATSRAKPGASRSSSSLVNQAKSRAAVRALVTTANALSQCRDCSVVLTRIDTNFGVKSSAPNINLYVPLKSATCATSRAKSTTCSLTRISSAVVPRPVSLTKSVAGKVSTSAVSGSAIRSASQTTESETVGCLKTKPFVTLPKTRAAVRAAALATAIANQRRDCRVVLRRMYATCAFISAAPNVTATTRLGSASCAKFRAKSDGLDVTISSLTSSTKKQVIPRSKTSATYSNPMQQPRTRAAVRAAAFNASATTLSQCRDCSVVVTRVQTSKSR